MIKESAVVHTKPARDLSRSEPPAERVYEVTYEVPNGDAARSIRVVTRTVAAAYWTTDGDPATAGNNQPQTLDFISFKDRDHKRAFTVRRTLVHLIEEVREPQGERPAPFNDIIDADRYKNVTGTGWDESKILRAVLRGRLAIDSARVLLGLEPFNLPETLHAFTYTQCPNGCHNLVKPDGTNGASCSECPA